MIIKGLELKEFEETGWPGDDWFWDHDLFDEIDPDAKYDTDDIGHLLYQGCDEDPTKGDGLDLAKLIRRWRKEKANVRFVVDVPKDKTEYFKQILKSLGGSIA